MVKDIIIFDWCPVASGCTFKYSSLLALYFPRLLPGRDSEPLLIGQLDDVTVGVRSAGWLAACCPSAT